MSYAPHQYPEATTEELLNELDHRNETRQAHRNMKEQTAEHLRKVRLSFSVNGGLGYRRTDG